MNIPTLSTVVGLVATLGGGGYWFATELEAKASKDYMQVVESKADYSLDKNMEYILTQINRIEAKPNKTQYDYEQLKYLRSELARLRQIRTGG